MDSGDENELKYCMDACACGIRMFCSEFSIHNNIIHGSLCYVVFRRKLLGVLGYSKGPF